MARKSEGLRDAARSARTAEAGKVESPISVYGDFPNRAVEIPRTLSSLLLAIGRLGEKIDSESVLVPYIEIKFGSGFEDDKNDGVDEAPLFSQVVQMDNAAFIIFDMMRDFRIACEQLSSLAAGELKLRRSQIEPIQKYISRVEKENKQCLEVLNNLAEQLVSK